MAARARQLAAMTVENGCSEAEAATAAEKLAKLLQDENLTLDEAQMRESPMGMHREADTSVVGSRLYKPAMSIAKLTNTKTWRERGGQVFLGLDHEVEIAGYMLAICRSAMNRGFKQVSRDAMLLVPSKRAAKVMPFLDGMADRLAERILAMVPVVPPGTGLVVVRDALITEEMARLGIELESMGRRRSLDFGSYQDGRKAAEAVGFNAGVRHGAEQGKLLT